MKNKILIVEDDLQLGKSLYKFLKLHFSEVVWLQSYQEAFNDLNTTYDIYILDINLKDGNGLELCKEIRKMHREPILMLTVYDDEKIVLRSFECGCDDYVNKPFSSSVLLARINALLRRSNKKVKTYRTGELLIDMNTRMVYIQNENIKLTPIEFELMEKMISHPGLVITRKQYLQDVWDRKGLYVEDNTLNVNMSALKRKLKGDYIETIRSVGYRWKKEVTVIEE